MKGIVRIRYITFGPNKEESSSGFYHNLEASLKEHAAYIVHAVVSRHYWTFSLDPGALQTRRWYFRELVLIRTDIYCIFQE